MKQSWMEGYTTQVDYTTGYYREQEPNFINFSAVMHGIEPVSLDSSFTYCELGCGLGMTSLIMAANYPQGNFIAIDYKPSHIAHAVKLATKAGLTNIEFLELSFEDINNDKSILPQCDFITFHGIYSWVSDDNRKHLTSICKKHLKSGGLVYNSYNALPGWAAAAPLQKMINCLNTSFTGSTFEKISSSIGYINHLKELKSNYFELNASVLKPRLDTLNNSDIHYLAHEYLNDGWKAFHSIDVATEMSSAKLNYIGLCNPAEAYSYGIMPDKLKEMLGKLDDPHTREMIKDIAYNTSFRKDLYTRGGRKINKNQQIEWLSSKEWIVLKDAQQESFKFSLSVGEATGNTENYQLVIDTLKNKPLTTQELQKTTKIEIVDLIQILTFLYSSNSIAFNHKEKTNKKTAIKLNKVLAKTNFTSSNYQPFVASEIGTAIFLNPIEQGFLTTFLTETPKNKISEKIYNELASKDLNFTQDGDTYTGEAMKEKLKEMEVEWRKKNLPHWIKLGVV